MTGRHRDRRAGYSFDDELSGQETYPAGTVAMANGAEHQRLAVLPRLQGHRAPASYDVIGQMDSAGTEVVKQIAEQGTSNSGSDWSARRNVTIESVTTG